jgi:hypothetical protein
MKTIASTPQALTLARIHEEVTFWLTANPKKVQKRRGKIAAVAEGLRKLENLEKMEKIPTLRPRMAWFSTTQTQAQMGRGQMNLQVLGKAAGTLSLDSERKWMFEPNLKGARESWQWSKNPKDAKKIREFLLKAKNARGNKLADEREIQWQLADALRSHKQITACRGFQSVTWNGCFTEIGVSVNRDGKRDAQGAGTLDLMVRHGRGSGFLVLEVKAPGDSKVEAALIQALRYATALEFEANEGGDENQKNYNVVFGSNDKCKLKIGAVVVMKDGREVRRDAPAILHRNWKERGNSKVDRIGMLLYKFDRSTGKANSWDWLPGWDVRNDFQND